MEPSGRRLKTMPSQAKTPQYDLPDLWGKQRTTRDMFFFESEPAVAFGYGGQADDSEKIPALRAISTYCRATHPQVSTVRPQRLVGFLPLRIGKGKLSVLRALSEAGGSRLCCYSDVKGKL